MSLRIPTTAGLSREANRTSPQACSVQCAAERKQDMQKSHVQTPIRSFRKGFTIVELLVVVSIIALLVGILLPAIGKARDQAQLTRSQANIKQISTAINTYAAEFADRQPTWIKDNISTYGNYTPGAAVAAFTNYANANGDEPHPMMGLGYGRSGAAPVVWFYAPPPVSPNGTPNPFQPIVFAAGTFKGFGSFRMPNALAVSSYLSGRWYDPVYYAPKDTGVMNSVESLFGHADGFPIIAGAPAGTVRWSSYCMSAAAMFNPAVFSKNGNLFFTDPWTLASGFKSPSMSQALFPNLKTHLIEHHWLQNRKKECHPNVTGPYEGCQPYYFNGAFNSQPVASFYDGHVAAVGQTDAIDANKRMVGQTGINNYGLWSMNALGPNAAAYSDGMNDGYFMQHCQDWSSTSYHVLTIDGIRGRDFLPR
jgi:prepilin-type N-terminal cleavage/methylation domain-containing protein